MWLRTCRAGILTLALLVAAELVVRIASFSLDGALHPWRYQNEKFLDTELGEAAGDTYVLRPNLDTYFAGGRFRTNEHGFRGGSVAVDKPPGVVRIAVLGSSYSLGQGLDDDETYPARLQALLDARLSGHYEVLNFAVSNHRIHDMASAYRQIADRFRPDLVLVEFYDGFLWAPMAPSTPEHREPGLAAMLSRYSFLYTAARRLVADHAIGQWSRAGRSLLAAPTSRPAEQAPSSPGCAELARFVAERRSEGVDVAIVRLARLDELAGEPRDVFAGSRRCCSERAGCSTIDTLAVVRGGASPSDHIFYGNDHPDARVARLYAEAVFAQLEPMLIERGLEPREARAHVEHAPISIGAR